MAKHPRLHKRGNTYYFRAKYPIDLLFHFQPAKERTFTLRTSDRRAALERVRVESVKFDQEMEEARRRRDAAPKTSLSNLEIDRLCAIFRHRLLDEDADLRFGGAGDEGLYLAVSKQVEADGGLAVFSDAEVRRSPGMSDREFHKADETIETLRLELKPALARGDSRAVADEVDALLEEQGIRLDTASETYRTLSAAILKAYVGALEDLTRRHAGDVVETPPEPLPLLATSYTTHKDNPPLSEVFEMYKKEKQRQLSVKTIQDFTPNIRRFVELHGDLGIKDINRDHIRSFKEAMLQVPSRPTWEVRALTLPLILERTRDDADIKRLSPTTVNEKALATLSAVIGWADDQGLRDGNPALGLKIKSGKFSRKRRAIYSIDDLNAIFRLPVFLNGERPKGGAGEAAKWLPLLALYTGARLEELGQLRVRDVKRSAEGIWFLDLITLEEDQRLKSDASRRRVPIHRQLIELGFIDYAGEQREAGATLEN